MAPRKSLPVLMPHLPDQRWSCHSCGTCCRTLVGHLFPDEVARLDEQNWAAELGVAPYLKTTLGGVLNKQPDGACVFLDAENKCRIHAKFGEKAKPIACRIFPFAVRPVRQGWQVSFRFDCPSAAESKGIPISQHRPLLDELTARLEHDPPADDDLADLQPGGPRATLDEIAAVEQRFLLWLQTPAIPLVNRIIGAARVTAQLESAKLAKVRGKRLVELLDILFGAEISQVAKTPPVPSKSQLALLRQLCFAHAEHVSLAQRHGSLLTRISRRWTQLTAARQLRRGVGLAPPLPDLGAGASFADIESVRPATADAARIEDLLTRYLSARLLGRSVFGSGYYGWAVTSGFSALWLSVAAAGWLSRYAAASTGCGEVTFGCFAAALAVVDRAASRVPSLGTHTERTRIKYLHLDDGVARLVSACFPTKTSVIHPIP